MISYLARYGSVWKNKCGAVVGPGRGPMGSRAAGQVADDVLERVVEQDLYWQCRQQTCLRNPPEDTT